MKSHAELKLKTLTGARPACQSHRNGKLPPMKIKLDTKAFRNVSRTTFQYSPDRARPKLHQRAVEIQAFGTIVKLPIALSENVCRASVERLNQVLADTMSLRDLYKKHHWQVSGSTFYQLHLLFDKHFGEQVELVDQIAERIQALGGLSYAMAADVAENTNVPRPPKGREEVSVQISRLLEAHEIILQEARAAARKAAEVGDDGTNDLLVSSVIRTNEMQVWFLAEHLVGPDRAGGR
jgi:starvation-inducible DNA-binding protein